MGNLFLLQRLQCESDVVTIGLKIDFTEIQSNLLKTFPTTKLALNVKLVLRNFINYQKT